MAASNVHARAPSAQHFSGSQAPNSPPKTRDLASWWSGFKKKTKKEEEKPESPSGIFGVPLATSIKYANVAISLTNEKGESYTYGYVPIVIAKCGVFLKEKGTDVHGIFRLPGSAKRIKDLQATFDSADRYGKGLDWSGFTVHDAGSIFRRYINSLPEPVIPLDFYEPYRDPIRSHQKEATGDQDAPSDPTAEAFDHAKVIAQYQKLITELPPLNRQLLLYLLDLLAVFSSKSEVNGMDSSNLSAIFQPGILSHPKHDLMPREYKLSQNVLVYMITNQDHFLVGMSGTEADEKTVKDVQSGPQPKPATPNKATHAGLGRSASNASAGADSLRRLGLRRNTSVSSKKSNLSGSQVAGSPAPGSPMVNATGGGGVHRSNTVPSKRSPGLNSSPRFSKQFGGERKTPRSNSHSPAPVPESEPEGPKAEGDATPQKPTIPVISPASVTPEQPQKVSTKEETPHDAGREIPPNEQIRLQSPEPNFTTTIISGTPTKERKSIFSKSPNGEGDNKDGRQPNKLKKKSRPADPPLNISAQSSSHSLQDKGVLADQQDKSPKSATSGGLPETNNVIIPTLLNTEASPATGIAPRLEELDKVSSFHVSRGGSREPSPSSKPAKSPVPSIHSGPVTEDSEAEQGANASGDRSHKRKSRWRISSALKKENDASKDQATPAKLDPVTVAEDDAAARGSPPQKPSKRAATEDSQQTATGTESSNEKDVDEDGKERRGLFGRIKAKVHQSKEERRESKAEKERAKSPPRSVNDHGTSKQSLNAIVSEGSNVASTSDAKLEEGVKIEVKS